MFFFVAMFLIVFGSVVFYSIVSARRWAAFPAALSINGLILLSLAAATVLCTQGPGFCGAKMSSWFWVQAGFAPSCFAVLMTATLAASAARRSLEEAYITYLALSVLPVFLVMGVLFALSAL